MTLHPQQITAAIQTLKPQLNDSKLKLNVMGCRVLKSSTGIQQLSNHRNKAATRLSISCCCKQCPFSFVDNSSSVCSHPYLWGISFREVCFLSLSLSVEGGGGGVCVCVGVGVLVCFGWLVGWLFFCCFGFLLYCCFCASLPSISLSSLPLPPPFSLSTHTHTHARALSLSLPPLPLALSPPPPVCLYVSLSLSHPPPPPLSLSLLSLDPSVSFLTLQRKWRGPKSRWNPVLFVIVAFLITYLLVCDLS